MNFHSLCKTCTHFRVGSILCMMNLFLPNLDFFYLVVVQNTVYIFDVAGGLEPKCLPIFEEAQLVNFCRGIGLWYILNFVPELVNSYEGWHVEMVIVLALVTEIFCCFFAQHQQYLWVVYKYANFYR